MVAEGKEGTEFSRAALLIKTTRQARKEFNDIVKRCYEEKRSHLPALLDGEELKDYARWSLVYLSSQLMEEFGEMGMTELRTRLEVPKYTITRVVSWMKRKGLVECSSDPNDQRVVRVALTDRGRQYSEVVRDLTLEAVQSHLSRLTPDEQIIFIRLNEKLAGISKESR